MSMLVLFLPQLLLSDSTTSFIRLASRVEISKNLSPFNLQCLCLFGNLECIAVGLTYLETSILAEAKVTQEASRWFVFRAVRYKRLIQMQLDTNATYLQSVSADAGQYLCGYLQCIHPKAGNPRDQTLQCHNVQRLICPQKSARGCLKLFCKLFHFGIHSHPFQRQHCQFCPNHAQSLLKSQICHTQMSYFLSKCAIL